MTMNNTTKTVNANNNAMDEDLRHDRDGLPHTGIDIGIWGVYEDEKGNFILMN